MNKKLFLLLAVCLLIVPTVLAISRSTPHNVSKITEDICRIKRNQGSWSSWSSYWKIGHYKESLQLNNRYEVLQYPYYKTNCVSDILVFVNSTQYTWDKAIDNNIVGKYICIYKGGSNFPKPVEVLDPFQYYIFKSYTDCILLFELNGDNVNEKN